MAKQGTALGAAGLAGAALRSVGGGDGEVRAAAPVAYSRPGIPGPTSLPLWALVAVIVLPPVCAGAWTSARRRRVAKSKREP